ncbi:Sir2 family NAD-dependent protein deacetylase [Roseibium sp. CAU 1637]|uniref:protein acetyllysine N-acetyltransferase n=1 Tax=Roseibium limicola TaxID=2816037 RepID=A0A939ELI2_9HYPH|nr:Sir2 family NAD-dependent protein deacetylase [Roseibium limicola]MBO0344637.1 Sir2 family NAD-dependent protein deacetylase [Roseibium limicola]
MTEIMDLTSARAVLDDVFAEAGADLVVMTGAGISTASGIPDFRSPGGLWSQIKPIQFDEFVHDPAKRREDWRRRFEMKAIFDAAEPNAGHLALADMARAGSLRRLITQNVDNMHQRSGVPEEALVELHGNSTYATCLVCSRREELESIALMLENGGTPVCTECGGLLKAAVVSFGQAMPEEPLQQAAEAARRSSVFLVVGSSLVVHPAAQLPAIAVQTGAELIILNREQTPLDQHASFCLRTPIAETLGVSGSEKMT